jgi:hypothetical protein
VRQGRLCLSRAVVAAAGAVVALPGSAAARPPELHDRVISVAATAGMQVAAHAPSRIYLTANGNGEPVEVSRSSAADPAADQALVDVLGSLLHGTELRALGVHIGSPADIRRLCGGGAAVACYAVHEGRMYVPDRPVEGVPLD